MTFDKICNGRALYIEQDKIWTAKGLAFYAVDHHGRRITKKYAVGSLFEKMIGAFRLSRQLLRVGIHHLLPLKDGSFLITLKKKTVIVASSGAILTTFSGYRGNKPAHRGVCITPDGTIFFGEYTLNPKRDHNTTLFRSTDNGRTFQAIVTFPENEVRHIHFVQWDKYENCLWMGTGDEDHECKLMRSFDNGDNWETVGSGSQLWRAVGLSCAPDAIYWGTDAGSVPDPNIFIRMSRASHQIEKLKEVQGPCHGNAVLSDGTVYISTGVEGGENEADRFAHLWERRSSGEIKEILKLKKDIWPLILQYGVMRFPSGMEETNTAVCTMYGLSKASECVCVIR